MLLAQYDVGRTFLNLALSSRRIEPEHEGKGFAATSTGTGSYSIQRRLASPFTIGILGHRRVSYSLFGSNAYYVETRNGVMGMFPVRDRFAATFQAETGTNTYPVPVRVGAKDLKRVDDATTVGGGIAVRLYRAAALATAVTVTKYDSNIPGFTRTVTQAVMTFRVSYSKDFFQ